MSTTQAPPSPPNAGFSRRPPANWPWLIGIAATVALILLFVFGRKHPPNLKHTNEVRQQVVDTAKTFFVFALVVGSASMALIQTGKGLFPIRGLFHFIQIKAWFGTAFQPLLNMLEAGGWLATSDTEVHSISQRRGAVRMFDLPLEQVVGQIAAAIDFALASPIEQQAWLRGLLGQDAYKRLVDAEGKLKPTGTNEVVDGEAERQLDEARGFASQRIQRRMDAMQIAIGSRWRWLVRWFAVLLCGAIATVTALLAKSNLEAWSTFTLVALVLGGFFAWFTRDVVAAIERLRR